MIELLIVVIVLVLIMFAFIVFVFKNILKKVTDNSKKYFINKMETFDYILEEKNKELEELRKTINELEEKKGRNNIVKEKKVEVQEVITIKNEKKEKEEKQVKIDFKSPQYRETEFFKNYRELRKVFNVNTHKILREFIKEHINKKEEIEYDKIKKIREKFDEEAVYQCMTLNKEQQILILEDVLTPIEQETIELKKIIKENEKFNIEKLMKIVDKKLDNLNPTVYVYVNYKDEELKKIDKHIKLQEYNNMSEGIIIKFRNEIYDYSI